MTLGTVLARRPPEEIRGSSILAQPRTRATRHGSSHLPPILASPTLASPTPASLTLASLTLDTPIRVTRIRGTPIRDMAVRGTPTRGMPTRGMPTRGMPTRGMATRSSLIRDLLIRDLLIRDSLTLGSRRTLAMRQISTARPEPAEAGPLGSCLDRRGQSRTGAWPSRHLDRGATLARPLTGRKRATATQSPSGLPTL